MQRFDQLRFLVLDELHTYRGRQGADVALLVRRLREASTSQDLLCVGTSATLSSEGTYEDRQAKVADIASLLFGAKVQPGDVIGETLQRSTPERALDDPVFLHELTARVKSKAPAPTTFEDFVADPLSIWIESTFGLREEDGRLARAVPLAIDGPNGGSTLLASATGLAEPDCQDAIRSQLMAGYEVRNPVTGFPAFAFRLHQFLSRGDTVYASPEVPSARYLTLAGQRFVPGDRDRVLLPLAFCRACGQDYYVVSRMATDEGSTLVPRDLGDTRPDAGLLPGFLYLSTEDPWPDDAQEVLDRVPDEWLDDQGRLKSNHREHLPKRVVVRPDGSLDLEGGDDGVAVGWLTEPPFRFCLRCGVSYAGRLGRDFSRLTTLGSEGRSTATTIMSLSAVRYLRKDEALRPEARKLLSFTDNRQDASLQAGHFNDFVQVTLLRAALWRAVAEAGDEGLAHDELPVRVFDTLGLPFELYARESDLKGRARSDTDKVLREVLAYRLYRDLERGWRLTQPNLEQCGLLRIEYESLDELVADQSEWSMCHDALSTADPVTRRHILQVLLDTIRRDLAIKVDVLDRMEQEALDRRAQQRLTGPWSVEDERLQYAPVVRLGGRVRGEVRDVVNLSSRGGFGQFLRRSTVLGAHGKLTLDDTTRIIGELFGALRRYGLLENVGTDEEPAFQLPAAAMRWIAGDGSKPYQDHIRMPRLPEDGLAANSFFTDLYRQVGEDLLGVRAAEHTAQVSYDERVAREEQFRSAQLPVLYCSPTMELGVDISQLNVVNMRNVPPTPANYAQRSGRAGRSGQPALVFTYCAAGSSHDQHFFRQPEKMVAGQVEAPRLELANEDLLRAHVHAIWLAESGLDLGASLRDVLDLAEETDEPELFRSVLDHLNDPIARARARDRAARALFDLMPRLSSAPWWSDTWLDDTLNAVPARFREALTRWRTLYKAALQQAQEQQRIKLSATRTADDRRQADRLRREAENQLELLRAESDNRNQSDFYTYRYFAAEGFLPGYSFPRLPLSAFIPGRRGRKDEHEFLQRPRFLAISEFGPQSLIYHEGARYRINRVILPVGDMSSDDGTLVTSQAKRCESCGYLHPVAEPPGPDVCARCGELLGAPLSNLFRLQNVSTVRRDRITSDEEERQRSGYEIISGVHFARRHGRLSVQEAVVVGADGKPVLRLAYGDTSTIWRINLGWRRRKDKQQHGFVLDLERGYWGARDDAEVEDDQDPMSRRTQRVVPYVEDTRNALLIEPVAPLSTGEMASLESALKTAFEVVFQLEESELASEPLPSSERRNTLLFYESAEGGAGALRRLVEEPGLWHRIAEEALLRCHIDPDTLVDVHVGAAEPCEAACYDCLLSYRNQMDHQILDRLLAKPWLAALRGAQLTEPSDGDDMGGGDLDEQVESGLEAEFIEYLRAGGYRLPDRAQVYFEAAGTRPDFVFDDACAVVYVDGPHHDYPDRQARDAGQSEAMRDLGYKVIRLGHRDDWAQIIDTHRAVFGQGAPA